MKRIGTTTTTTTGGGGVGKEAILDLGKYLNQAIEVKFTGGREIRGILKGFD